MKCVAKTFEGLEPVLEKELEELGARRIQVLKRAVEFETDQVGLYRINYNVRTALNILVPIASDLVNSEKQLYAFASKIKWDKYLDNNKTFAISNTVNSPFFTHSQYAALKLKDAIVDYFRRIYGTRPSIDRDFPDIKIDLHIHNRNVNISLDSSGQALFKRGYKKHTGAAPINEVLAAGIIELSGWDKKRNFIDPMCGSGTILIEAFMKANNIPAGYCRPRFGFQDWANFSRMNWKKVKEDSNNNIQPTEVTFQGYDEDRKAIEDCIKNTERLPHAENLSFKEGNFFKTKFPSGSTLIFNPPYDKRLELKNSELFYSRMGDHLKKHAIGCNVSFISGHLEAIKQFGLRANSKKTLMNGPIPAKLLPFELYEGTKKNKD